MASREELLATIDANGGLNNLVLIGLNNTRHIYVTEQMVADGDIEFADEGLKVRDRHFVFSSMTSFRNNDITFVHMYEFVEFLAFRTDGIPETPYDLVVKDKNIQPIPHDRTYNYDLNDYVESHDRISSRTRILHINNPGLELSEVDSSVHTVVEGFEYEVYTNVEVERIFVYTSNKEIAEVTQNGNKFSFTFKQSGKVDLAVRAGEVVKVYPLSVEMEGGESGGDEPGTGGGETPENPDVPVDPNPDTPVDPEEPEITEVATVLALPDGTVPVAQVGEEHWVLADDIEETDGSTFSLKQKSTINFGFSSKTLPRNIKYQLKPVVEPADQVITYASTNEEVVKVDEKGKVTVIGKGQATIKATTEDGVMASVIIKARS